MPIDDYEKAIALKDKLEASLPIKVRPGKQLLKLMRDRGQPLSADQELLIDAVYYIGDEGGISCKVADSFSKKENLALVNRKMNSVDASG